MEKMRNFRNMSIWQLGVDLTVDVYDLTKDFPERERFGLINQMRRAAVSIPSNIAEGSSRSERDFDRFLRISLGSTYEIETQLRISERVGYCDEKQTLHISSRLHELQKMLYGFSCSLRNSFS
jgi:four helix bundle protein